MFWEVHTMTWKDVGSYQFKCFSQFLRRPASIYSTGTIIVGANVLWADAVFWYLQCDNPLPCACASLSNESLCVCVCAIVLMLLLQQTVHVHQPAKWTRTMNTWRPLHLLSAICTEAVTPQPRATTTSISVTVWQEALYFKHTTPCSMKRVRGLNSDLWICPCKVNTHAHTLLNEPDPALWTCSINRKMTVIFTIMHTLTFAYYSKILNILRLSSTNDQQNVVLSHEIIVQTYITLFKTAVT